MKRTRQNPLLAAVLAALPFVFGLIRPATAQTASIHVEEYGAIPDDGNNDLVQIQNAFNAAFDGAIVEFAPGVYDLFPQQVSSLWPPAPAGQASKEIFPIKNKPNVVIHGNGATLLCHDFDPTRPYNSTYFRLFVIDSCPNFEIRDLTINMSRLPYSVGECTGIVLDPQGIIANNRFFVDMDPSFQPLPQNMTIHWLMHYKPDGKYQCRTFLYTARDPAPTPADFVVQSIQGSLYEIKGNWPGGNPRDYPGGKMMSDLRLPPVPYGHLDLGDRVVFVHQAHGYSALNLIESEGITVSNITVHAFPGMAINGLRCKDLLVDGLVVVPDPMRPWPVTITSCALHLQYMSGDLTVQGCHLEGMIDDGLNNHSKFRPVHCVHGTTDVVITRDCCGEVNIPGEIYEFYDANMLPLGTATLQQIVTPLNCSAGGNYRLSFNALPAGSIAHVANLSRHPTSVNVLGCTVQNNRGVGFKVRRDAYLESCTVIDTTSQAVEISPDLGLFNEGPGGGNVTVQSCTFDGVNQGWGFYPFHEGAVSVLGWLHNAGVQAPVGAIAGVNITGCTIKDVGGCVVSARSCNGITIDTCSFQNCSLIAWVMQDNPPVHWAKYSADSLLYFRDSANATILTSSYSPAGTSMGVRWQQPMVGVPLLLGNTGF